MGKRPLSVTVISWLYIVMGAVGFAYHITEFRARQYEVAWVEAVRLIAFETR